MGVLIAVANLKGGCGKSNIAVHLACELAGGRRTSVVLVDADVQATASYHAGASLLPLRHEQTPLEDSGRAEAWIRRVLTIGAESDYVVLDAPPHTGTVTKAIVGIADLVLIPCSASTADLMATAAAVELVRQARQHRTDSGPACLLVPSRIDRRTLNGREIETALRKFGEPVGPAICQRTAFVDAFTAQRAIGDYAPGSDAHREFQELTARVKQYARTKSKTTKA